MRLTVGRLMAAVSCVAVALAAARVHPALCGLAAAVSSLALFRTFTLLDRSPPEGWLEVLAVFSSSAAIAATIVVGSLLPGLCLLPCALGPIHSHGYPEPDLGTVFCLFVAGVVALPIASVLRRKLW